MNNSGTIRTGNSVDRVTFKILIGGEEIPGTIHVKSLQVVKEVNRIPFAKFAVLDGDPAEREFKASNSALFVPGKEIEITAGYQADETTIFKGTIIRQNIKIRENHYLLLIEAKDITVKMTLRRKSNYFYEMSDGDLIENLITAYGISHDVAATNINHAELVQYDVTDWDFMMLRSQINGLICVVEDGKIILKKPDLNTDPVETVTFGASLLEFDAEMDCRTQVPGVVSQSWNAADQELLKVEGNDPNLPLNGNINSADLSTILDGNEVILRHGGNKSSNYLQEWADAKWTYQQLAKTRGRIKFQGIPQVKPGSTLLLEGVGDRFSGKVFISAVNHQITEGNWTIDAQFGLDPHWFAENQNIYTPPASGITAAISGLHIGIVTQLQDDPAGEDRIMIKIPIINQEEQGIWCRQLHLDAGDERGINFRPEIGDEVIVGFINEDPNDAVMLGALHSSAKPAPIPGSDDNHEKGIITRSGIKMIFNDDKKSFLLETPGGNKLEITDDDGSITLQDEQNNKVILDSGGITLESAKDLILKASGDIKLEGVNISAKANAEFKAEGSAGAELSTSAVAVLKGSLVQIN